MAFLYKDVGALRVSDTDNDPEKMGKLRAFRAELEQKRIVKHWLTGDELVGQVKDSINDMVRRRPAIGWIRGDQAFDPEVYRERDELRRENEKLKEKLANEIGGADSVARGKDVIEIFFDVNIYESGKGIAKSINAKWQITCDDLINVIIDQLYETEGEDIISQMGFYMT
jgi:hypothetical protein